MGDIEERSIKGAGNSDLALGRGFLPWSIVELVSAS